MEKIWLLRLWECEEFDHMKTSDDSTKLKNYVRNNCGPRMSFKSIGEDALLVLRGGCEIGMIGKVKFI
jgi:hypothetical protein